MRTYLCIDLKSFYASVECVERGLDPMSTRLVVADPERSEKTICLAVSPAMKVLGVPGRCRVFELPRGIEYIMAPPRMQLYIDYSVEIYGIYLKYIAKEDIHVYSIDEVFMDITNYLPLYKMTPRQFGEKLMQEVQDVVGIPSACGIGTNLYLAKVALDITAKHAVDRIGELDEKRYCETLWRHKPLSDFWRVGEGIAGRLEQMGIYTMEQIAHTGAPLLYRLFGVDAELLLDHAWGRETATMADIKAYQPRQKCISSGQVLECDYSFEKGLLIAKEMADLLSMELVEKGLVTDSVTLHVGYSNRLAYKAAHGTQAILTPTSSGRRLMEETERLYQRIVDPFLPVRRLNLTLNRVTKEAYRQYDLFSDLEEEKREYRLQSALLEMKRKYGKNAVLKGMNLQEGATAQIRNCQIGGHKSGI